MTSDTKCVCQSNKTEQNQTKQNVENRKYEKRFIVKISGNLCSLHAGNVQTNQNKQQKRKI